MSVESRVFARWAAAALPVSVTWRSRGRC